MDKFKNALRSGYTYLVAGGLITLVSAQSALAQTNLTWTTTDTDEVASPAFTAWKSYFKWFLILAIPILIALYYVGRALGIFQGRR